MIKVGLTGGIAAGKSQVAELFRQLHVQVIDADRIAHQLSASGTVSYQQIVAEFGPAYVSTEGELDRRKLRTEIFSNPESKRRLEAIMHPKVRQQLVAQIEALHPDNYCILSIPLLLEASMDDLVDQILVVDCEPKIQIQRLMQRDNCDRRQALQATQNQTAPQQRHAYADFVIHNNSSVESLKEDVDAIDRSLNAMHTNMQASH